MRTTTIAETAGRILAVIAALLGSALAAGATPAQAAETTVRILRVPADYRLFLPCANGGAGEVVHFSGTAFLVLHATFDDAGGVHVRQIEMQQGVQGVGESTGDRYVSPYVNLFGYNMGSDTLPSTYTQETIYRVDAPGPGVESLIRIRNHGTINANGTVTVTFEDATFECLAQEP